MVSNIYQKNNDMSEEQMDMPDLTDSKVVDKLKVKDLVALADQMGIDVSGEGFGRFKAP